MKYMQQFKGITFILLFSCMMAINAVAQSAYSGKTFLVAFGKNDDHTELRYQTGGVWDTVQLILRITAVEQANVSIKFNNNPSLNDNVSLNANEIFDYKLSYNQALASYSGVTLSDNMKSIVVSSTGEITLMAMNTAHASTEATLVMPVEILGTEYMHTSLGLGSGHTSGFLIIATEDNTVVKFDNYSNAPGQYTLKKKGEVYAYNYGNAMWGLHITATKPIAYFLNTSKGRIHAPSGSYYRENFNFEQLAPVNQWGTKFIVPTVSTEYYNREGMFARILSKESTNNIQITYTDGSSTTITEWWGDIRIDNGNHNTAKAAYIKAETPISVCIFHAPYDYSPSVGSGGDASQPGVAWLPPVEQTIGSALISPLDLDGRHVYLRMIHDFIIITPTVTKNSTTIAIDGSQPQSINSNSKFQWISDNIGGSGYSFGRYRFGAHSPQDHEFLNTTALVENPNGILLLAYGQGSYTNYFYTVGAAARDLDMAAYINGTHFYDIRGRSFCDFVYEITAISNLPTAQGASYPRWYFDGIEDTDLRGQGLVGHSSMEMITKIFMQGEHTVKMEFLDANNTVKECVTNFTVSTSPTIETFTLPEFCNYGSFNLTPPAVTGGSILFKGWQLEKSAGSDEYHNINVPYKLSLSDNGKRIRYYVENVCGATYSNSQTMVVNPTVKPAVEILVK